MAKPGEKHSENYYFNVRERIHGRLSQLPRGTVKERLISGRKYYYLQRREGKRVVHTYLGREIPEDLKKQMAEREALRRELENVREVLRTFWVDRIKKIL